MARLGYRVINVGERDLQLGYDDFENKLKGFPFEIVSSNIVKQGTQEPVFKPYVIVDVTPPGGGTPVKVGVTGVVRFNPVWQKAGPGGENLAIASPLETLKKIVPELRAGAEVVVLLAALSKGDAQRIAQEVPGIDFVFGAYGGIDSTQEEPAGSTRIYYVGNQGKRTLESRVYLDGNRRLRTAQTYMHFLNQRYPEDKTMQAFVAEAQGKIAKLHPVAAAAPAGPAATAPGAGGGH